MIRFHLLLAVLAVPVASWAAPAPAPATDILGAYKKELAFLEAEKRALTRRLGEVGQQSRTQEQRAETEVNSLQGQVLSLRAQADELEQTLRAGGGPQAEEEDRVGATIERAAQGLKAAGIDLGALPGAEDGVGRRAALARIFHHAALLIGRQGKVRRGRGAFFLQDGRQVTGALVRVGRVASFGISPGGSGALAPAGDGRLKLWHQPADETARALAAAKRPGTMRLFLYESLDRAVRPRQEKTAIAVIQSGGLIAWVIVALGGLALVLILARLGILWRSGASGKLLDEVQPLVARGRHALALDRCRRGKSSVARCLSAAIARLGGERQLLEDAVAEAMLREVPRVERFGSAIAVFAAVAPLLGLLGTVTGMISTFDVITEHGTGDPKLLAGGISEALVTTELGLMVAIPTLLIGTLLNGLAESTLARTERATLRVLNVASGDVVPGGDDEPEARRPAPELAAETP